MTDWESYPQLRFSWAQFLQADKTQSGDQPSVKNLLGSPCDPYSIIQQVMLQAGSLWLKKKPTHNGGMLCDELSASLPISLRDMLFLEKHLTVRIQGWILVLLSQADSCCRAGGRISKCRLWCFSWHVWVESVLLVLLAIVCTYFTPAQTSPSLKVFNGRFIPDAAFLDLFALRFF